MAEGLGCGVSPNEGIRDRKYIVNAAGGRLAPVRQICRGGREKHERDFI